MNDKVKVVLKGFIELNESEKREFINEIQKYIGLGSIEKGNLNEILGNDVKRILGPTSSNACPCCGR